MVFNVRERMSLTKSSAPKPETITRRFSEKICPRGTPNEISVNTSKKFNSMIIIKITTITLSLIKYIYIKQLSIQ